jgi:hypothetical protein
MDTSEPTATAPSASTPLAAGAPAAQSGMNVTTSTGAANKVATHIAVTHFNLNPQMPHAIVIVAKLRVTSPSLEGTFQKGLCPRVSAGDLRLALAEASSASPPAVCPCSDRPARGRVFTLGAARRASAASSPTISPSSVAR